MLQIKNIFYHFFSQGRDKEEHFFDDIVTIKGVTLQKIKHALFLWVFTEREKLQLKDKKTN